MSSPYAAGCSWHATAVRAIMLSLLLCGVTSLLGQSSVVLGAGADVGSGKNARHLLFGDNSGIFVISSTIEFKIRKGEVVSVWGRARKCCFTSVA